MSLAQRWKKKILNFQSGALGRRIWNVFSKNLHKGLWYWKSCNYSLKPTHENPYSQYKRFISSAQTLSTPLLTTELQSTNVFIIHGLTKTRGLEAEGELTTPATYLIMTISDITPRQQWLLVDNAAASGPTLYTNYIQLVPQSAFVCISMTAL
jgi:hypothetical protein